MAHAYVSYAKTDVDAADKIAAHFEQAHVVAERDPDRERSGTHLSEAAAKSIAGSFAFIVLFSQHASESAQVRRELERAIEGAIPILPVILDDTPLPPWWQERLRHLVRVDARADDGSHFNALLNGVRRFFDRLCPVISLMNMKGGVGKTTIASQVFAAMQKTRDQRILLIDLDPQHNLSQLFFRRSTQDTLVYMDASVISLFEPSGLQDHPSPAENWHTVNVAAADPPQPEQIVRRLVPEGRTKGRFDIICGQFDIAKYAFLDNKEWIDTARRNFVRSIDVLRDHYDLVVLDTNPSASFLTRCAFAVSTRILAPVRPDRFSIRGVRLLNDLMTRLLEEPGRPPISMIFNNVERAAMSELESDVREGKLDPQIGFSASRATLEHRLHASKFLAVREEGMEDDPLAHLAIYRAGGLWGGALQETLKDISDEIAGLLEIDAKR